VRSKRVLWQLAWNESERYSILCASGVYDEYVKHACKAGKQNKTRKGIDKYRHKEGERSSVELDQSKRGTQ